MLWRAGVHRIAVSHPGDTAPLAAAFDGGIIDPRHVVAIMGKTEGNGCVNDFTRGFAVMALRQMLSERLEIPREEIDDRIAMVMSGGTEGGLSPHLIVFSRAPQPSKPVQVGPRLAIGTAFTRTFAPDEIGRMPQVHETANAVRAAMMEAGIEAAADVHFVQIKCPLLTKGRIAAAVQRGATTATQDTYHSMALSRGASSLGVALALDEIDAADVSEAAICRDWRLYSGRASASAGIELMRNEVLVIGNAPGWGGDLAIAHAVMADAIDLEAARRPLRELGLAAAGQLDPAARERIAAVLAKADPSRTGTIRGRRHIMLDDSDIQATRHARALVGGVLAGLIGDTGLYVSGGAEHQGPDGGGPVAVIAHIGE